MSLFDGVCVASITPFASNGLDRDCIVGLIERYLSAGVNAVCVLGTTGEPATVTPEERVSFYSIAREVIAKRVPLIAGVGCNGTAGTIKTALQAEACGADGLLVVTPYYNRCTQNGLYLHFKAVCEAVKTPIIAYNVPARTGVNMLPETACRVAALDKIVGIKEASGNAAQFQETARLIGDKAAIYAGDDSASFIGLCLGSSGTISVAAAVDPHRFVTLHDLFRQGKIDEARSIQNELAPLVAALQSEVNPIPVKRALSLLGYGDGYPRMPLTPLSENEIPKLKAALSALGLT